MPASSAFWAVVLAFGLLGWLFPVAVHPCWSWWHWQIGRDSAEAGAALSLLLELMVKRCCKLLLAICEQQAFLSFFNCPKAGLDFHKDKKRYVLCFCFLYFAFQNPPSPDQFPNFTSDVGS